MTDTNAALAQLLSTLGTQSHFATQFAVKSDPQLYVEGVGEIALPIDIQTAHRLCAAAQPAYHGYKEQTRLDKQVRDTWEIPANRLRFDAPKWASVLERTLKKIAANLGLPPTANLQAELHNLLIYAPGQFFIEHQDSEKTDGMIGTLVINLPSPFSGGEFVIEHLGERLCSKGKTDRLEMVAFYADCHHEVRPVTQGYRIVLTYNLTTQARIDAEEIPPKTIDALTRALTDFWNTPVPFRWKSDTLDPPPDRLVYLLDHEYTRRGLGWTHLKGADAVRVAALRQVAQRLDADICLALADTHETWDAEEVDRRRGRRSREMDSDDIEGLELGDLIDSDVELLHWVTLKGKPAPQPSFVKSKELCMTLENADCRPFETEYTGYMGNYGNTLERWYHRAAVVMWPRARAFAMQAQRSPEWGVAQIAKRVKAKDTAQALAWSKMLLPHWHRGFARNIDPGMLDTVLSIANAIDDPASAAALLEPFALHQFTPSQATSMSALLEHYGLDWYCACWRVWNAAHPRAQEQLAWLAQVLPVWTQQFNAASHAHGPAFTQTMLSDAWKWLQDHVQELRARATVSKFLRELKRTTVAHLRILQASVGVSNVHKKILDSLVHAQTPLQLPLDVLREAHTKNMDGRTLKLARVHAHCVQVLEERLAQPARAKDGWSITTVPASICKHEPAKTLMKFLIDTNQRVWQGKLAQHDRDTVVGIITRYELPVSHETLRTTRPYTLVLEKQPGLFTREASARRQWATDLAWLGTMAARFGAS